MIEEREQVLELHVSPEPLVVYADRVRLVQAVTNLLNNAARYTPPKGHIKIHCQRVSNELELCVEDGGQGISPNLLPHIFEACIQGDEHGSSGLGLGLSIVRRLAMLHGGSVSVESEGEGRGSKFIIRLPLDS